MPSSIPSGSLGAGGPRSGPPAAEGPDGGRVSFGARLAAAMAWMQPSDSTPLAEWAAARDALLALA